MREILSTQSRLIAKQSTQLAQQEDTNISQWEAISYLSTKMPFALGLITPIPPGTTPIPTTYVLEEDPDNPTFTPTPSASIDIEYPPDTRTGLAEIDVVIDAVMAQAIETRVALVDFTTTACTTGDGLGGQPKCEPGEQLLVLTGPTFFVEDVEFSPNGKYIVGASDDSKIYFWESAFGTLEKTLMGHYGPVNGVTHSPSGSLLSSTSNDQSVRLWDARSGDTVKRLQGHTDLVIRSVFNPEGMLLASISWDGTVVLWGIPNK